MALKNRLGTEPELQALLAQYVPIVLDTGDPDFATWRRLFPPTGNGIPMLFIVGPKGDEFYNRSGAPQGDGLKQLLLSGIEKNGGPIDLSKLGPAKDEKKLVAALRNAKLNLAKKQTAEAIALLVAQTDKPQSEDKSKTKGNAELDALAAKAKPKQEPEKTGPAKEIDDLLAQLSTDAKMALDKARENLKDAAPEKQLVGVVGLVAVKRLYSGLPAFAETIEPEVEKVRANPDQEKLLVQAEAIDVARAWEAKDNSRAALAAYRKVVSTFPGTPAAALSQLRIDQLSGAAAGTVAGIEKPGSTADAAADLKKAAAMLKMAKTFGPARADKAREYASKVIELAPTSTEAREAQKLLDQLK